MLAKRSLRGLQFQLKCQMKTTNALFSTRFSRNNTTISSAIITKSNTNTKTWEITYHRSFSNTSTIIDDNNNNNNNPTIHKTSNQSTIIPYKLADIGEGIFEVELLKWFINSGDTVKLFDKICEVQSDKATVQITSRYQGKIHSLLHQVGDIVKVGDVLVNIDTMPMETIEKSQGTMTTSILNVNTSSSSFSSSSSAPHNNNMNSSNDIDNNTISTPTTIISPSVLSVSDNSTYINASNRGIGNLFDDNTPIKVPRNITTTPTSTTTIPTTATSAGATITTTTSTPTTTTSTIPTTSGTTTATTSRRNLNIITSASRTIFDDDNSNNNIVEVMGDAVVLPTTTNDEVNGNTAVSVALSSLSTSSSPSITVPVGTDITPSITDTTTITNDSSSSSSSLSQVIDKKAINTSDVISTPIILPDNTNSSINRKKPRPVILASPAVRKLARDQNVRLDEVTGTGSDGRILKIDVLRSTIINSSNSGSSSSSSSDNSGSSSSDSNSLNNNDNNSVTSGKNNNSDSTAVESTTSIPVKLPTTAPVNAATTGVVTAATTGAVTAATTGAVTAATTGAVTAATTGVVTAATTGAETAATTDAVTAATTGAVTAATTGAVTAATTGAVTATTTTGTVTTRHVKSISAADVLATMIKGDALTERTKPLADDSAVTTTTTTAEIFSLKKSLTKNTDRSTRGNNNNNNKNNNNSNIMIVGGNNNKISNNSSSSSSSSNDNNDKKMISRVWSPSSSSISPPSLSAPVTAVSALLHRATPVSFTIPVTSILSEESVKSSSSSSSSSSSVGVEPMTLRQQLDAMQPQRPWPSLSRMKEGIIVEGGGGERGGGGGEVLTMPSSRDGSNNNSFKSIHNNLNINRVIRGSNSSNNSNNKNNSNNSDNNNKNNSNSSMNNRNNNNNNNNNTILNPNSSTILNPNIITTNSEVGIARGGLHNLGGSVVSAMYDDVVIGSGSTGKSGGSGAEEDGLLIYSSSNNSSSSSSSGRIIGIDANQSNTRNVLSNIHSTSSNNSSNGSSSNPNQQSIKALHSSNLTATTDAINNNTSSSSNNNNNNNSKVNNNNNNNNSNNSNNNNSINTPTIIGKIVPIRGIQRIMATNMTASLQIQHLTFCDEILVTELIHLKALIGSSLGFVQFNQNQLKNNQVVLKKISYLAILIKMTSLALADYPILNATVNATCTEMTYHNHHNIGIAMDTRRGLMVPAIERVEEKSILEIAMDLQLLQEAAAAGTLTEQHFRGASFTLSNIGTVGGTYAVPVVSVPQVAIGAFGSFQVVPRYIHKITKNVAKPTDLGRDSDSTSFELQPRSIMNVSWSADHRVIDGATIAKFSNLFKGYVESPNTMLTQLK